MTHLKSTQIKAFIFYLYLLVPKSIQLKLIIVKRQLKVQLKDNKLNSSF